MGINSARAADRAAPPEDSALAVSYLLVHIYDTHVMCITGPGNSDGALCLCETNLRNQGKAACHECYWGK